MRISNLKWRKQDVSNRKWDELGLLLRDARAPKKYSSKNKRVLRLVSFSFFFKSDFFFWWSRRFYGNKIRKLGFRERKLSRVKNLYFNKSTRFSFTRRRLNKLYALRKFVVNLYGFDNYRQLKRIFRDVSFYNCRYSVKFLFFLKKLENRLPIILIRLRLASSLSVAMYLIRGGFISVNYRIVRKKNFLLKSGDMLHVFSTPSPRFTHKFPRWWWSSVWYPSNRIFDFETFGSYWDQFLGLTSRFPRDRAKVFDEVYFYYSKFSKYSLDPVQVFRSYCLGGSISRVLFRLKNRKFSSKFNLMSRKVFDLSDFLRNRVFFNKCRFSTNNEFVFCYKRFSSISGCLFLRNFELVESRLLRLLLNFRVNYWGFVDFWSFFWARGFCIDLKKRNVAKVFLAKSCSYYYKNDNFFFNKSLFDNKIWLRRFFNCYRRVDFNRILFSQPKNFHIDYFNKSFVFYRKLFDFYGKDFSFTFPEYGGVLLSSSLFVDNTVLGIYGFDSVKLAFDVLYFLFNRRKNF